MRSHIPTRWRRTRSGSSLCRYRKFLHVAVEPLEGRVLLSTYTDIGIDARANIFGAGHAIAPGPGGGGGGVLPPDVSLPPGSGRVLTFSSVTGAVSGIDSELNGPDGGTSASGDTDITSYGGISGIVHPNRTMFLVGVFLADAEPIDPAPPG